MTRTLYYLAFVLAGGIQDAPPTDYEPSRHYWLKWKPGTYVVIRHSARSGGQLLGEWHVTGRLDKVTEAGYELLEVVHQDGKVTKSTRKDLRPRRVGEEIVEGKLGKRTASIWECLIGDNERGEESRIWLGAGYVPLRWKTVARGYGPEDIHIDLSAVALDEELTIGTAKVRCTRLEGTAGPLSNTGKAVEWWSDSVPGGVVRFEGTNGAPPDELRYTYEVVKFGESRLEDPPPGPPEK